MKISKIAASIAAAALAVSSLTAMSASAVTAGATSVDFEDGDCSFVYMNTDSGASNATLTVEDYNGSKQLKVDVADKAAVPKVWFDLDKILPRSELIKTKTVECDLTIVSKDDATAVGYAGGAFAHAGGFDTSLPDSGQVNPKWGQKEWDGGAYNPGEVVSVHLTQTFMLPAEKFTEEGVNPFVGIMRWAAADGPDYVMYVDNLKFTDDAGNAIAVGAAAPAAEETAPAEEAAGEGEAAPAEDAAPAAEADVTDEDAADDAAPAEEAAPAAADEAAPAETTAAAPAADTAATTAAATGNVAVASIAAVMAVAGAAAIASRKRK